MVTVTVSQEISRSGWWPIASAGSTMLGDEVGRADEVAALVGPADRVALALPSGQRRQPLLDLGVAQQRHRGLCCHGRRSGRNERLPPHPLAHRRSRTSARRRAGRSPTRASSTRRRAPLPGAHIPVALWLTRGEHKTFPVLQLDGRDDRRLDRDHRRARGALPEPPLYPADPEQRRRALELEEFFDEELGPARPPARLPRAAQGPGALRKIADEAAPGRWHGMARRAAYARTYTSLRWGAGDDGGRRASARAKIVAAFDRLEAELGVERLPGRRRASASPTSPPPRSSTRSSPRGGTAGGRRPSPAASKRFREPLSDRRGFKWVEEMFARHASRRRPPRLPEHRLRREDDLQRFAAGRRARRPRPPRRASCGG